MLSTYIEDGNANMDFDNHIGSLHFSFPIVNKYSSSSFKFRIFEHYLYLYKGERVAREEGDWDFPPVELSEDCNTLILTVKGTAGLVSIKIPYDSRVKRFFYDCASAYLDHFIKRDPASVPKLYVDTLRTDYKTFVQ